MPRTSAPARTTRTAKALTAFLRMGSGIDVPVRELPRMYHELKAPTGVTFVTDAVCRLPADVRDAFLAWKRAAKARLVSLVRDTAAGDLAAISDEIHLVATLASDAVSRELSL